MRLQQTIASVSGVILAGGKGSRMGGKDKGLILYQGKPLYQHVVTRLTPQVARIYISANRNLTRYQQSGLPVLMDKLPDFPGPLAGMLTAMQSINAEWLFFSPCDTPALPANVVSRLWEEKRNSRAVWACAEGRDHPAIALMHASLADDLANYLACGERRVMVFLRQAGGHSVPFDRCAEAFANINLPEDLLS
ncbi:molybdenum cofactor guanylyltransferase MobA [Erwinia sp. 9145]|uniref:molybdenum cofactor guanylyltransferase MobA n=1 Tax=Erwinia sp. 9145 TaxID=1500895 RepID=UPI00054DBA38|nr:molybdenum cofactor guanylyltransferase MobA [Erwinia sp. 9145]